MTKKLTPELSLVRKFNRAMDRASKMKNKVDEADAWPKGTPTDVQGTLVRKLYELAQVNEQASQSRHTLTQAFNLIGVDLTAHHAVVGAQLKAALGFTGRAAPVESDEEDVKVGLND